MADGDAIWSIDHTDEDQLRDAYHGEGMSLNEIADAAGVAYSTVWRWMDKHGVERRDNANHVNVTDPLRDFIHGLMAGDGCLVAENRAAYYAHSDSTEEHVEWLSEEFAGFGVETVSSWVETRGGRSNAYHMRTRAYRELLPIQDRWYDRNGKSLPDCFSLSPTTLLMWYVGDGSYIEQDNGERNVVIYCEDLNDSADRIVEMLRTSAGVESTFMEKGVYVHTGSHDRFFGYMDQSPLSPAGYAHKFP